MKLLKRLTRGLRPTRSPLFSLFHIIETADLESQPPNWTSLFSQTLCFDRKLCQMKTHRGFLVKDIVISVKKPVWTDLNPCSRIRERVQSYFVLAECFLSLPPTVGHHACLKVKANPIPRSQKSKWSFIFYLSKHQSSLIYLFVALHYNHTALSQK